MRHFATPRPGARGKMRYDWWRAHHGLPSHSKWRGVAREAGVPVSVAFHIVVCLLDTASRGSPRGSIEAFKPFDCAGIVDVPAADVERVLAVLKAVQWISGHMIAEWDDRQPQREDAGAAARKAEERSRKASVTNHNVTHLERDKPECHTSQAGQTALSQHVTTASVPDRDKDITSTFSVAAREEKPEQPADSLASALVDGALTRPPSDEQADQSGQPVKRPSDVSRAELDAILAKKAASATDLDLAIPGFLKRTA